jgi:hypothetical protein
MSEGDRRLELFLELQRRYFEVKETQYLIHLEPAPRRSISLPTPTADLHFFLFSRMLTECVGSLVTNIDQFACLINKVCALNAVYEELNEQDKPVAYFECIHPTPEFALSAPYTLRQRFLYSTAKLTNECLQAGLLPGLPPLEDERDIGLRWLKSCVGAAPSFNSFLETAERLDDESFNEKISCFNSRTQHRIPLNIEHGDASVVLRYGKGAEEKRCIRQERLMTIETSDVYCCIGALKPLKLGDVIPLLADQHKMSLTVFYAFEKVVGELLALWRRERGESLEYLVER